MDYFITLYSVNTHARAILSSGNDSNHKNNSEKLLYMLKNVLLMYFLKSKLADFEPKLTILSPYISVNTHVRAILSSENDLVRITDPEMSYIILLFYLINSPSKHLNVNSYNCD